jgi:serine/threonine protein kinase
MRRRPPSSELRNAGAATPGPFTRAAPEGRDLNEGRFDREFFGVTAIGKGQFSTVYRAQNRIDQCLYAVKKTSKISARGMHHTELREVFALANVSMEAEACQHIVRYYSSWMEDGRLHIQTELCECSLRDRLAQRRSRPDPRFEDSEVAEVLRDTSTGLQALHSCGFAHLDVKPDNILVGRHARGKGCYKIADLGLAAAAIGSGCDDICEGDCRYLAKEVLRGDLTDLPRADVFSLGLVCYELATNPKALPCNGEEWHRLRDGHLDTDLIAPLGKQLVTLLVHATAATPSQRPLCEEILRHKSIAPAPADDVQALQEQMRQKDAEAQRSKRLADEYWHEMVSMKRQELLSGCSWTSALPAPGDRLAKAFEAAATAAGSFSHHSSAASFMSTSSTATTTTSTSGASGYAPVLRRGKTS